MCSQKPQPVFQDISWKEARHPGNQDVEERGVETCPNCTGEMQIISFIYQHQLIRKILEHLKIYEEKKQRAPPLKKTPVKEADLVPFDDGWPGYENPVFEV